MIPKDEKLKYRKRTCSNLISTLQKIQPFSIQKTNYLIIFRAVYADYVRIIRKKQKHSLGTIAGLSHKVTAVGTTRLHCLSKGTSLFLFLHYPPPSPLWFQLFVQPKSFILRLEDSVLHAARKLEAC
jgi:hypothetical protein